MTISSMAFNDRRRRRRLNLHWQVRLRPGEGRRVIPAETENVSSSGFYCTAEEPLSPGDRLECELCASEDLVLRRRVMVVRVEIRGLKPGFGIACEFEYPAELH